MSIERIASLAPAPLNSLKVLLSVYLSLSVPDQSSAAETMFKI